MYGSWLSRAEPLASQKTMLCWLNRPLISCCHDQPLNGHGWPWMAMVHLQPGAEELEVFSPMTWYDVGAGALCTARIHDIYSAWDRWQMAVSVHANNMEQHGTTE